MKPITSTLFQPKYSKREQKDTLFDLSKIKCQLTFINKEKNIFFYENLKQQLNICLNTVSYPIENIPKKLYLTFFEQSQSDQIALNINTTPNLSLYFYTDVPERRDKVITSFQNQRSNFMSSRLIIFYEDDTSLPKDNNSLPSICFIKPTQEMLFAQISQVVLEMLREYADRILIKSPIDKTNKFHIQLQPELQSRTIEYIHLQKYSTCIEVINKAIDSYSGIDEAKWKEIKAIVLFAIDFHKNSNKSEMTFNDEVADLFENVIKRYLKEKQYDLLCEALIRLFTYYTYFEDIFTSRSKKYNELSSRMINLIEQQCNSKKFVYYLKIANVFNKLKMERKFKFYFYHSMNVCYQDDSSIYKMVPFMFREISKMFDVYDVSQNIIETYSDFIEIHKKIIANKRKPIAFYCNDNNTGMLKESNKKKVDKGTQLTVMKINKDITRFTFMNYWNEIQKSIFNEIISFYSNTPNTNIKDIIKYQLGYLQTLHTSLTDIEQTNTLNSIINLSLNLQDKHIFNLTKIPILMRIIPLSSEIKFDTSTNPHKTSTTSQTSVFLYNPWEKSTYTNYYWTKSSYQSIRVQLYNPLNTEIVVNKIKILFKGINPISYPSSVRINPQTSEYILCKIYPDQHGITNVIGVQYEIVNCISQQYADNNGNGLYFNFENISEDSLNLINNNTELISLSNIKIYPEIPLLDIKIKDNNIIGNAIELYDNQMYSFSFILTNIGKYDINEISCYVYCYKKDDYKIALDEIKVKTVIKVNDTYVFNYNYLHKSSQKKIEFRLYYVSYEKNAISEKEDDELIKPYLFYTKNIDTLKLVDFIDKKVIPVISNSDINDLIKNDNRIKKQFDICYNSLYVYISFILDNYHESKFKFEIMNKETNEIVKEDICDGYKSKEISFKIPSELNINKLKLKWMFTEMEQCIGEIEMSSIFNNYNVTLWTMFEFDINVSDVYDGDVVIGKKCMYTVINKSDERKEGLKLYVYLYQKFGNGKFMFNHKLKENILYDGALNLNIPVMEGNGKFEYDVNVFPMKNDEIKTSCLVLDKDNKCVYMCPITKEFVI